MAGKVVVAGAGYTGGRVAAALGPAQAISLRRRAGNGATTVRLDLDRPDPEPLPLPESYRVLYTIPPAETAGEDPRLERFLALLEPRPSRFVYVGTSGVYGDCGGERVEPEAQTGHRADSKTEERTRHEEREPPGREKRERGSSSKRAGVGRLGEEIGRRAERTLFHGIGHVADTRERRHLEPQPVRRVPLARGR